MKSLHNARYWREWHEIDEKCKLRMKAGEQVYAEADITVRAASLMARDLIEFCEEELLDVINYAKAEIIKIRILRDALDANEDIQRIAPTGKPQPVKYLTA